MHKRALVTGGAGFIGSHLVENLLASGWNVSVLDNFCTGNHSNLADLPSGKLAIFDGSVTDKDAVNVSAADCDVVFHLAALADIVPSIEEPLTYFETNVSGTAIVMETARNQGIRKVVYAASSSCYGLPEDYPTNEAATVSPQYPYALTKWLGEETVRHWGNVYQIPWVSLRLFNVFGPRSRTSSTYGAVLGVFLAQKIAGKPLTVVGDGHQTRDFTYVTDVAEAFRRAAESTISGEIMNVGSGDTYSINYLASLLGSEKTYIPQRPGGPAVTFADIQKISSLLGWKPDVSFEEGIEKVLCRIDDWKDAPLWDASAITEVTAEWFRFLGHVSDNR